MEEINCIKDLLVANKEKKISSKTMKRLIGIELFTRMKIYIPSYELREIIKSIDDSKLSNEQREDIAKFLIEKASKSVESIKSEISKLIGSLSGEGEGEKDDVQ